MYAYLSVFQEVIASTAGAASWQPFEFQLDVTDGSRASPALLRAFGLPVLTVAPAVLGDGMSVPLPDGYLVAGVLHNTSWARLLPNTSKDVAPGGWAPGARVLWAWTCWPHVWLLLHGGSSGHGRGRCTATCMALVPTGGRHHIAVGVPGHTRSQPASTASPHLLQLSAVLAWGDTPACLLACLLARLPACSVRQAVPERPLSANVAGQSGQGGVPRQLPAHRQHCAPLQLRLSAP